MDKARVLAWVLCGLAACKARQKEAPKPKPIAAASSAAAPAPSPSAPPKRERHPGIKVAIEGGGTMNESHPYLVPDRAQRPVTVILHALCADEIWMCDWLQYGELAPQWQVCPRAPSTCPNGGAQWTAPPLEHLKLIERAIATTKKRHGARVGDAVVLAGMSQGAYTIAHVLHLLAQQEFPSIALRGVVLHGAFLSLDARDLRKLKIRVVLAAGEQDGAASSMKALAKSLAAQGVEAKYESFGDVGHFLPVDSATPMSKMIAWARGE